METTSSVNVETSSLTEAIQVPQTLEVGVDESACIMDAGAVAAFWALEEESTSQQEEQGYVYFKARTPTDFKAMVRAIAQLCDEATLEFTAEGMAARLMDPSHIALLDVFWPNHGFESYECRRSGEGPAQVGIRANELAKILKDFDDKRDCVKFRSSQDSEMFSLDNGNGSVVKIRAIEPSCSTTPLPKLSFACKVVMDSKALEKVLKSVRQVSEHVTLTCGHASASFSGKGDAGEIDKRLEPGMEGLKKLELAQDAQSAHYTLDYLAKMHSVLKALGSSATLEYSQNMPLRIEYRVAGVGRVHYYQAPRVHD